MHLSTRRAARRRKEQEAAVAEQLALASRPCLTNLPEDLVLKVAEQLPHASLPKLGSTCAMMQRVVHSGVLWRDIGPFPTTVACCMSDNALAKLLTRVNARASTTSISLTSCCMVNGSGLAPLAGSTVLRSIDLRRDWLDEANGQQLMLRSALVPSVGEMLQPMLAEANGQPSQLGRLYAYRNDFRTNLRQILPQPHGQTFKEAVDYINARTQIVNHGNKHNTCCTSCFDLLAKPGVDEPSKPFWRCPGCLTRLCGPCELMRSLKCVNCRVKFCDSCLVYIDGTGYMCDFCIDASEDEFAFGGGFGGGFGFGGG